MSLLSVVEQAIKSCKAEQEKINDSIQLYREILQALTPQPKTDREESEYTDAATTDTNISPGEKEDIELLEQALEKALWVRTGSGTNKKDPDRNKQCGSRKEPGTSVVTSKDVTQLSASSKEIQTSSKSASLDRKEHRKPGSSVSSSRGSRPSASNNPGQSKTTNNRGAIQKHPVSTAGAAHHQAARKLQQAGSASGSKKKSVKDSVLSADDPVKTAAISTPSSNNTGPFSHTDESGASLLQHTGIPSEQTTKWKSLRNKQNRLWDKVMALQRKPAPGRSHFVERMRATFPKDWPCGSPDQTRALVNRLTHQGHDLIQQCQTMELLAKLTPEAATEQGGKKNKYDSYPSLEKLQMTAAELHTFAAQVKQEAELRELERLRMQVVLLQQEINLEQALLDTLSPQLSSIAPGPGCPNASVLRDIYSLLGEGGERFPVTVLDSEPE
ncbi:tubulin epsilon and delta complex protein 2 isoform X2 [Trachinotus anak]|uniref:tubulin epsilon and delta complex protein 2 isoform X2 n=1 Tax=Trachinotus anak TaxID=443729 RepID=UPI0039F1F8EB